MVSQQSGFYAARRPRVVLVRQATGNAILFYRKLAKTTRQACFVDPSFYETGVRKTGSEVIMARLYTSTTHDWSEQEVKIEGRTFFHRHCQICMRDFARSSCNEEWRAVHVGLLKFDLLDEETSRRWVSEDCPRRPLPGEQNDRRMQ
jgi:hypothetical protein